MTSGRTSAGHGRRLLVYARHSVVAEALRAQLAGREAGFADALVATSAGEVDEAARRHRIESALLHLESGDIDVVAALCRGSPETHVVALVDERSADEALRAGAVGVVGRRADIDQILAALGAAERGLLVLPRSFASRTTRPAPEHALTDEERTLLEGLAEGLTNAQLARTLHLSDRTVRRRLDALYTRLGADGRVGAVANAARRGLL